MNKQTVEQIIQELKWKNGKYNPNPSYVIFGKRKSMYLSTTEYIIKFDNNYIRGIHRKNNNLVSIQYKSVTKIVELKQIYIGKDYKSLEIIEPTENQEITVGIPFDVEVHADSQSPLKIYYNGHLIGTLNFVNGVATGQITLSEEYVDSIGGEYYVIDDDTLIPANDLEGKLVFVSGDYAGNVNVKIMPYDKFSQGEAYISDTHTEIKTDNVWSNSELMRGIIPSNHIIPSDLHEQGEAIVSVEVACIVRVYGVAPLNLLNAHEKELESLKVFGKCCLNGIPDDYTELEYIESDGNQYIDTGIRPSPTLRWELDNQFVEYVVSNGCINGVYSQDETDPPFRFDIGLGANNRSIVLNGGALNAVPFPTSYEWSERYTYIVDCLNNFYQVVGLVKNILPNFNVGTIGNQTIYLFKRNYSQAYRPCKQKTYSSKIYDNDILIQDFVPVKRKSDNELGMYDRVSQRFFTNQGTGTFIAGNAVTPSPDKPVDIVCNNGVIKRHTDAEGWSLQNGTPTPTSPIAIENYHQKDMVLRGVSTYKDTYNALTNTITRKVGVKIFTGSETEFLTSSTPPCYSYPKTALGSNSTVLPAGTGANLLLCTHHHCSNSSIGEVCWSGSNNVNFNSISRFETLDDFKQFLTQQYQNGTPVTLYYPLATETQETWSGDEWWVDGTQENITVGNSSANAEYLLKLGDYVDSQDILNGIVNRQLGIKVFDGSEELEIASSQPTYTRIKTLYKITNASTGSFINTICSHFFKETSSVNIVGEIAWYAGYCYFGFPQETTKEEAKNWFTQQYQNGTPVIVIYPLAIPTTEQVSPQPMSTVEGNNTLEISGSLPDLEAEVEYWEKT